MDLAAFPAFAIALTFSLRACRATIVNRHSAILDHGKLSLPQSGENHGRTAHVHAPGLARNPIT